MLLICSVAASNIVVYDPATKTYYSSYPMKIHGQTIYVLNRSQILNETEHNITIIHKIEIENTSAVVVYDEDMIKAYQALISELKENVTKLQNELDKKNKLLAEYISYKKKNIELQKNITQLKRQITQLEAENEMLKEQNREYRELITDLINKQSNETKDEFISAYNKNKKLIGGFTWSLIIGLVSVGFIGYVLMRWKQKYEDL